MVYKFEGEGNFYIIFVDSKLIMYGNVWSDKSFKKKDECLWAKGTDL